MLTSFSHVVNPDLAVMCPSGCVSSNPMAVSLELSSQSSISDVDDPVRTKSSMLDALFLLIPVMRRRMKATHSCATLLLKVHVRFLSH